MIPLGLRFFWAVVLVRFNSRRYVAAALKSARNEDLRPLSTEDMHYVLNLKRVVSFCAQKGVGTCLYRSIAARMVLGRRGITSRVVIAPLKTEGALFFAHAWVQVAAGVSIGESQNGMSPFISVAEGNTGPCA